MATVQHNIKNNKKDVEYITYSTPWKKIINAKNLCFYSKM